MTIGTYSLALHPGMLQRGFWLYAWKVVGPEGEEWVFVGRTGDNSSPNAARAYIRMGQHLGSAIALVAAGYKRLNTAKCAHTIDPELWKPVREAFAAHFPRLRG